MEFTLQIDTWLATVCLLFVSSDILAFHLFDDAIYSEVSPHVQRLYV